MKKNTIITLAPIEVEICKMVALARNKACRRAGVKDSNISTLPSTAIDIDGFAAEFAFCKMFNVMPDFIIMPCSSLKGTDKGDAKVNGKIIDVKNTRYRNGFLPIAKWKESSIVDAYALMIGSGNIFKYAGAISKNNAIQDKFLRDVGRGVNYCIPQEELI